ncbi:putative E3 ubiquitin ligase complex SCF subunit scon-2 [Vanrija pseudolonga]|uniref:E3 ubiquitin ligase complex SCF subunit scon-2 n=1 Tax=Vanrija pseudolonga TaxID=143232 RepID=A0AAF1BLM8_9TREE|nr:putative E3 ubiquitin ligase complex SCF subunit scon-2 [Vanrija pseudolonga]
MAGTLNGSNGSQQGTMPSSSRAPAAAPAAAATPQRSTAPIVPTRSAARPTSMAVSATLSPATTPSKPETTPARQIVTPKASPSPLSRIPASSLPRSTAADRGPPSAYARPGLRPVNSLRTPTKNACKPSDIQAQIEMLERVMGSRTGVLGRLDDKLSEHVMKFLDLQEVLRLRLVSKRFEQRATNPRVWKRLCRELEAHWDGMVNLDGYRLDDDGDWLGLFKKLWRREKNWTNGQAQSLAVLSGHRNYVTSLKLWGETLISASYDDTIRIWNLPYAVSSSKVVPPPVVIPAKAVSSIDYYAPEQVLVTGSHEVGRASVWRNIEGEWKVEKILSGHLHGTRFVAINAEWLISVGSDKAIVVWDWRSGNKIVRFGQQTNVCAGMRLLDDFVLSATVDGVIRTFSIQKREMLGQFRLSELARRQPEFADKLKDVGVGALGMLTWFEAEGRFLAMATKDIIIRLAWEWADEEELEVMLNSPTSVDSRSFAEAQATSPSVVTPARHRGFSNASPRAVSPRSPLTPRSGGATPTTSRPSPVVSSKLAMSTGALPSSAGASSSEDGNSEKANATTTNTTSQFALAKPPRIIEILDITGTERGAFEAGRGRIVTSRRLSAKSGAERRVRHQFSCLFKDQLISLIQVLVGSERPSPGGGDAAMKVVPLGGLWETRGRAAGLASATKNPMSLALDHDKVVTGLL